MQFVEMGNRSGKPLVLLPGTACDYQANFGTVLDRLGEKYSFLRMVSIRSEYLHEPG